MQTTKDYIRKLLLETAQKAFFEKGFKSVSMREISKLSGIGLSNIYNYFSCKDDIFVQIVTPAVRTFENMLMCCVLFWLLCTGCWKNTTDRRISPLTYLSQMNIIVHLCRSLWAL